MSGKINLDIKFPVIEIYAKQIDIYKSLNKFTVVSKDSITFYSKTKTILLDSNGCLYKRGGIIPRKHINFFWGFQLPWGFGNYYSDVFLIKEKNLGIEELKEIILNTIDLRNADFENSTISTKSFRNDIQKSETKENVIVLLLKLIDPNHIHW